MCLSLSIFSPLVKASVGSFVSVSDSPSSKWTPILKGTVKVHTVAPAIVVVAMALKIGPHTLDTATTYPEVPVDGCKFAIALYSHRKLTQLHEW